MERAPCSGSGDVHCGQKKVESVTGARFTQSDSGDSKPICFGRRGCSQWFGCDWSFFCPWSHHDTIPVSTLIFPLLTLTSYMQWCFLYWPSDSTLTSTQKKKKGSWAIDFGQQQNSAWKYVQKTSICGIKQDKTAQFTWNLLFDAFSELLIV